jgi:hypothetical protein
MILPALATRHNNHATTTSQTTTKKKKQKPAFYQVFSSKSFLQFTEAWTNVTYFVIDFAIYITAFFAIKACRRFWPFCMCAVVLGGACPTTLSNYDTP